MLPRMNRTALALIFSVLGLCPAANAAGKTTKRTIPCKTPAIANSCYWAHGRLGVSNGSPAVRLWKIGTKRILGIYSGPSSYRGPWRNTGPLFDDENPQLPSNVSKIFETTMQGGFPALIFADFEICPLEPVKPGVMQAACIESAKNIVVEK